MALTYDIAQDFGVDPDSVNDYTATSPAWVLAVVRFSEIVTFDRDTQGSKSLLASDAIKEAGKTLVIQSDCISLSTHQTKSSHVSNLTATLANGEINYLDEILPGDWVFAWMVQSESLIPDLVQRIKSNTPVNNTQDGLKFVGRVQSLRKTLQQDPAGFRTIRYNLQANGFTEFDASIFFNPFFIQGPDKDVIGRFYAKLGIPLEKFIQINSGGISVNDALPALFETLLGKGLPISATNPLKIAALAASPNPGPDDTGEAPFAYCIPQTVGKLLGKTLRSDKLGAFADIVEATYGVQKYADSGSGLALGDVFTPNGVDTTQESTIHKTSQDMLGLMTPQPADFSDTTIWSIFANYLNPLVNEMYTTLRVNPQGKIVPSFIVRQLPFNTAHFAQNQPDLTAFVELPRWKIPPSIVSEFDIGRTNALRFNFLLYSGQFPATDDARTAQAAVRNPAIRDDLDIYRSGLRMSRGAVNCAINDINGPEQWMKIKSDILMGQHLTLNGTLGTLGIQSPIAVGDNLEFDGIVFHIESVSHVCVISGSGKKYFHTQLELTNGVNSDSGDNINSEYVGVSTPSPNTYGPGLTYDAQDNADQSVLRVTPKK